MSRKMGAPSSFLVGRERKFASVVLWYSSFWRLSPETMPKKGVSSNGCPFVTFGRKRRTPRDSRLKPFARAARFAKGQELPAERSLVFKPQLACA
jgi:hypothetical protein